MCIRWHTVRLVRRNPQAQRRHVLSTTPSTCVASFSMSRVWDRVSEESSYFWRYPNSLIMQCRIEVEKKHTCQKPARFVQSFRYNTGLWRTNGQTDGRTHDDNIYRSSIATRGRSSCAKNQLDSFCRFDRTQTCDGHRWTRAHGHGIRHASIASRSKMQESVAILLIIAMTPRCHWRSSYCSIANVTHWLPAYAYHCPVSFLRFRPSQVVLVQYRFWDLGLVR